MKIPPISAHSAYPFWAWKSQVETNMRGDILVTSISGVSLNGSVRDTNRPINVAPAVVINISPEAAAKIRSH